jgi:hypothetical protein
VTAHLVLPLDVCGVLDLAGMLTLGVERQCGLLDHGDGLAVLD